MKIKVLYVGGIGRNGSTILGNILGSISGFIHIGELMYFFDRGILENWECGCGTLFNNCPFWQKIVTSLNMPKNEAQKMVFLKENGLRSRHLFLSEKERKKKLEYMSEYLICLEKIYSIIRDNTGCDWIIDSSKFPSHAYFLSQIENIDLYILHLVRDPKSIAYSWWKRPKKLGSQMQKVMPRIHPIRTALVWLEWNYLFQKIWGKSSKYMFVRFEDFTQKPLAVLRNILQWLQVSSKVLNSLFINENEVRVSVQHTVSGNPVRFNKGSIKISPVTSELPLHWKIIISLITAPLMLKYGYRF